MAVTDPTAVAFCNEKVRPLADRLSRLYYLCLSLRDEWNARGGSNFIPNDAGEIVDDGADQDGRPVITGADVHNIAARVVELLTDYEANNKAKLKTILDVSVNPLPL